MCSKLTQYRVTATYREATEVIVQGAVGFKFQAPWLGHVRDDNPKLSEMIPVEVPGVGAMEHHGRGFEFLSPVSLRGFIREIMIRGKARQGLFLLTKSIQTRSGPDRWPVLFAGGRWRDTISKVWKLEKGDHRG